MKAAVAKKWAGTHQNCVPKSNKSRLSKRGGPGSISREAKKREAIQLVHKPSQLAAAGRI
jgi:hypothetical protein